MTLHFEVVQKCTFGPWGSHTGEPPEVISMQPGNIVLNIGDAISVEDGEDVVYVTTGTGQKHTINRGDFWCMFGHRCFRTI